MLIIYIILAVEQIAEGRKRGRVVEEVLSSSEHNNRGDAY